MSPEAGKPDAQTQTGSSEFVEGIHPTDGVRAFNDAKADLPDVHDALLERGVPESPSVIDPVTLEVPVDKIEIPTQSEETAVEAPQVEAAAALTQEAPVEVAPAVTTERPSKWKKILASVLGGTVLVGGGVVAGKAMSGGDTATEPRVEPSASAPASPGEIEPTPDTEPVSIDNIKTRPTAEQLALAEQPVTKEAYPTVEQAYPALIDRANIFVTGAVMDFEATPAAETPESVAAGERLLEVIYGPDYESRPGFDITGMRNLRHGIGLEFYYLYESRGEEGTFRINSEVTSIEETTVPGAAEAYTIHSTVSGETNIPELDPNQVVINVTPPTERETTVFLAEDGTWHTLSANNLD